MLNQCQFIGNLGADPEIRSFSNGNKVCNLRLACSERWKDKSSGGQRERTEWVNVQVFSEGLIRVCEQYLRKGSKIFVQGKMQTRKYQDQSGADKYSTEIVLQGFGGTLTMLDGKSDNQGGGYSQGNGGQKSHNDGYGAGGRPGNGDDFDQIPF